MSPARTAMCWEGEHSMPARAAPDASGKAGASANHVLDIRVSQMSRRAPDFLRMKKSPQRSLGALQT
eukprot:15323712-Alexandrium_andersonii.AAC.1